MKKVVLIDDHALLRDALATMIGLMKEYEVLYCANNGRHFIKLLDPENLPDIVIMDVTMPLMNGFETALWVRDNHPHMKVIALSMLNDERTIIQMLRNGAKGYLLKDTEIEDLKQALDDVSNRGMYINDILYKNLVHSINRSPEQIEENEKQVALELTEREKDFLKWLCTDKSYKEIATDMFLSPRTVDGYRDALFEKLKVTSRIGLVLFALRNEIVKL